MIRRLLVKPEPRRAQRSAEAEIWRRDTLRPSAFSAVHSWRRCRHGISLLEVLISMGVLAVGLLGIAALIPAGRHEIAQGSRLDNAAMIGRAAFRDLQVRGFLRPRDVAGNSNWLDAASAPVWNPSWDPVLGPIRPFYVGGEDFADSNGNGQWDNGETPLIDLSTPPNAVWDSRSYRAQVAFAIDPLGIVAGADIRFPHSAPASHPYLIRVAPIDLTAGGARELMDSIFRSSVDLISQENGGEPFDDTNRNGRYDGSESHTDTNGNGRYDGPNADLPPQQFWFRDPTDTDLAANMLRRGSDGDYSWLATIVSDPTKSALSSKVTVSVAVFHKRELSSPGAGEYTANVGVILSSVGGGEVALGNITSRAVPPQPIKPLRPGQWIMLAGRMTNLPVGDYYRWYRVVAARELDGTSQWVTLAGADWPTTRVAPPQNVTRAWIFDNVVAVYEKNLSLEIE